MIEIRNLYKTYETEKIKVNALQNISLTIGEGEIFGVIGLSGAGKSSLIRCINMLEVPTSGEIVVNGKDVAKLKPAELREIRKKIGMIFQHFNLLMNSTVFENIAFPLRISKLPEKDICDRVEYLLKVVDLVDKRNVYPAQLSGGQKQRVGIARALANQPGILLCDEATSALDPTTTESILALLKDINKQFGITIVLITHEMDVIKRLCNKVAVMENGVIAEQGSVIDIFSNPSTETSKKFLKDMIAELPEDILPDPENPHEEVIRLSFTGDNTKKPIISRLVREFNVDANILSGNIETIQDTRVGSLLLKLSGERSNISSAITFLEGNNIKIEVLG